MIGRLTFDAEMVSFWSSKFDFVKHALLEHIGIDLIFVAERGLIVIVEIVRGEAGSSPMLASP